MNLPLASHLTLPERRIVVAMLQRKISVAQIAVQLVQRRSTIHQEIRRNLWHDDEVPMATGHWHMNAQHLAASRRRRQAFTDTGGSVPGRRHRRRLDRADGS